MAGRPKKVTEARLKAVLKKHDGMKGLTARALGMSRQAVHERIQNNPGLQQFLADMNVQIVDTAEHQAFKKVRKGDGTMIRYILDTKARDRGYGKQLEGPPPPPPDADRRATVINILIQNLNQKASRVAVQVQDRPGVLNGHATGPANGTGLVLSAKPNGKGNGHG